MKKDIELILNKIKEYYSLNGDAEFARFLGIPPTTLSSWRSRGNINYDLLYSKCVDIDANFLLSGEGKIKRNEPNEHDPVSQFLKILSEKDEKINELNKEVLELNKKVITLEFEHKKLLNIPKKTGDMDINNQANNI
jgi:hypothetical protein